MVLAGLGGSHAEAANIAAPGTGILGTKPVIDDTLGTLRFNSGVATNIIDNNLSSRVDNFTGAEGRPVSFVGVVWNTLKYDNITNLTLTLATFGDGGWFGVPGAPAPAGGALAATNLIEPVIQVSTNGGTNWVTVGSTSDYQTVMLGHQVGGTGGQPNPSTRTAMFTLTTPATRVQGVRIIGTNGGRAGADTNGFLGVFELVVNAEAFVDADMDGMPDAWETEHSVSDPADDADFDGLLNLDEYIAGSDPQDFDTDGDTLVDGDEVTVYLTSPLRADTDNDGLFDGPEVNTYNTNPRVVDTDADGLSDGAEVNTHMSNPLLVDSDGDLFTDRMEVVFGGNPNNPTLFPDNIALVGTNTIGVRQSFAVGPDTPYTQQAVALRTNINDGNLTTRVDTFNSATTTTLSYVGVTWPFLVTNPVAFVDVTLATFLDGGWFGVNNIGPGAGQPLGAAHLTEPIVQVSTNGGVDWVNVAFTSDYTNKLTGHRVGGGGQPNPTSVTVVFTLTEPATNINAIRVIGPEGGTASRGFIGVFEFMARKAVSDSDGDGMADSWETTYGLVVGTNDGGLDADSDGLTNLGEFNNGTNPLVADTDGDGLNDGPEVSTHGTNPTRADTDADGLTDGTELTVHSTNPLVRDTDGDGFTDGAEIALGTIPTNSSSFPSNLALMGSASAIIGTKPAVDTTAGVVYFNAGAPPSINDGNLTTRVDTWNGGGADRASFVGILWSNHVTIPIVRMELSMAIFFDGGWFGVNGTGPGSGGTLSSTYLREPIVQVSTNGGTNWVTVAHASDYLTALNGHPLPAVDFGAPTTATAHFIFIQPVTNINGIRIIGSEGGQASGGFIGVFELAARNMVADSDGDGMNDQWEGFFGLSVGVNDGANDLDADGLSNLLEFQNNTKPNDVDTDDDGLDDGPEVMTYSSSPTNPDTDGDGLNDGVEVTTHGTSPTSRDTDGDAFSDGLEIALGTIPTNAASHPSNYALAGTGILGVAPAVGPSLGTLVFNSGLGSYINDGNIGSRVDNFSFAADTNSFVGILWSTSITNVNRLELSLATFFDGGWFGRNGVGPGSGGFLSNTTHLLEPAVQVTSDGGATWSTIPHSSDYLTALNGHALPAVDFGPPTLATARFYVPAQTNINGIRIIGSEGGPAGAGFLGVFELKVEFSPISPVTILNPANVAGQVQFQFDSFTGANHVVQFKNAFNDPMWQELTVIPGDGTRKTVTDSTGDMMRIYRVTSE